MIIFSIILGVLILCISVTLVGFTLRYRKDIKQIYYILGGYLTKITGVIVDNKGIVTSISGRKGIELIVKHDEDAVTVYLDLIFKDAKVEKVEQKVETKKEEPKEEEQLSIFDDMF